MTNESRFTRNLKAYVYENTPKATESLNQKNNKMTDIYTQLAKLLNVAQITDNCNQPNDLQISEWLTADNYELHIMTSNVRAIGLDFEWDVYNQPPRFTDIIDRIKELNDSDAIVYVSNLDLYLPEHEVEDYIESKLQEKTEA
jgi:hypothetical protein